MGLMTEQQSDTPQQTTKVTILTGYENGLERGEGGLKFLKYPDIILTQ